SNARCRGSAGRPWWCRIAPCQSRRDRVVESPRRRDPPARRRGYRRPLVICGNSRTAPPLPSPISRESRRSSPVLGIWRDAAHGSQKREGGGGTGGGCARPSSPLTRPLHHQSFYFLRKHIHRPVVFGQLTGHEHERLAANRRAIAVVHFWSHDHIR